MRWSLPGRRGPRTPGAPGIPTDARLLGIALFFAIAATNILTPLLPNVRTDLGISIATAGLVVSTYGFARLLTDLPSGFILDRVGERRLAAIGVVLLTTGSILGALAPGVEWLIVARITSGLGSGLITTVALTALSWTAGPSNRGQVMSVFQLANNTGIAFYPLVGGAIGSLLGWRATFVVAAAGALIAGAILMPLLRRIESGQKQAAVSGRTQAMEYQLTPRRRGIALGSIYAGVVANMINRHGFRNTLLPLFAASVLFLGPVEIATGIAVMAIVGILVVTPGARLGDRIGRRRIVVVGLVMLGIGDLTFLGAQGYWTFLLAAAVLGCGDFFASSQTAIRPSWSRRRSVRRSSPATASSSTSGRSSVPSSSPASWTPSIRASRSSSARPSSSPAASSQSSACPPKPPRRP